MSSGRKREARWGRAAANALAQCAAPPGSTRDFPAGGGAKEGLEDVASWLLSSSSSYLTLRRKCIISDVTAAKLITDGIIDSYIFE